MGESKKGIPRRLVVISGVVKGASFILSATGVSAGRDADNLICLDGDCVSRHHAELILTNGEYTVRDLNSRNGTFLNGQRITESTLVSGDRLRIGEFELRYEAVPTEPENPDLPVLRQHVAGLQARLTMTEEALACRTGGLEAAQRDLAGKTAEFSRTNQTLTGELDTLRKKNSELVATTNSLHEKLASNAESAAKAVSDLSATQERLRDVERQFAEVRATQEEVSLRLKGEVERAGELQAKNSSLELELNTATNAQAQFVAEVARMREAAGRADVRAGELERVAQDLRAELKRSQQDGQTQLKNAADELAKLQEEFDKARTVASEVPGLNDKVTSLTGQCADLEAKLAGMQNLPDELRRSEVALDAAHIALRKAEDDLKASRENSLLWQIVQQLDAMLKSSGAGTSDEMRRFCDRLEQAREHLQKIGEVKSRLGELEAENQQLRISGGQVQEELMLAKRRLNDRTTEEFSSIRRSMIVQRDEAENRKGGFLQRIGGARRA